MKVYSVHAKKLFVKEEHLNFVSKLVVPPPCHLPKCPPLPAEPYGGRVPSLLELPHTADNSP